MLACLNRALLHNTGLRKVSLLGKPQSWRPAPGGADCRQSAKTETTKPVGIPGVHGTSTKHPLPHQVFQPLRKWAAPPLCFPERSLQRAECALPTLWDHSNKCFDHSDDPEWQRLLCSGAGEEDKCVPKIIDPCSILSPEVIDDEQVLGSWADRRVGSSPLPCQMGADFAHMPDNAPS